MTRCSCGKEGAHGHSAYANDEWVEATKRGKRAWLEGRIEDLKWIIEYVDGDDDWRLEMKTELAECEERLKEI